MLDLLDSKIIDANVADAFKEVLKQVNTLSKDKVNISQDNGDIRIEFREEGKLPISILLWKNTVNIYIGKHFVHYASDVFIETENDVKELNNNLMRILGSEIKEVVGDGDRDFAYYATDGSWKWDNNLRNNKEVSYTEKIYEPWCVVP